MRVIFVGSKHLGLRVADVLCTNLPGSLSAIVTIDDRKDARSDFSAFSSLAQKHSVDIHVARTRSESEDITRRLRADCVVVVGWYWLFSPSLIASVPSGFIGLHNSLLPLYRGFSPLVWSLINGDSEVGYSIFSLGEGMDDGPVWLQRRFRVSDSDYVGDILGRIEDRAPSDMWDVVSGILAGTAKPSPQLVTGTSYCARRLPEDGVIDWRQTAASVRNLIRALSDPYPGAFTYAGPQRVTVWRAEFAADLHYGLPGQIAHIDTDGTVTVIAGDSRALRLTDAECDEVRAPPATFMRTAGLRFLRPSP